MLKHVGSKWYVLDSSGKKVLGKHSTKEKAVKQLSAIEISKKERTEESIIMDFASFFSEAIASSLQYHQDLNPSLWSGFDLKNEVREKLIQIGNAWAQWAKIPEQAIADMILVGGNANFNYTPNSDIDLHLLIDVDAIPNCPEYIDEYLKDKKQIWSLTHDIKIYGHDVELYAQDMNDGFVQDQGVYSLTKNEWLAEPKRKEVNLDDPHVMKKVQDYADQIDMLINSNAEDDAFDKLKKKFKEMRSTSLKSGGEFSEGNIIFKELRNAGYFDKMNHYLQSRADEELSL
jgi:predicted nucleotidyltransferase